MYNFKNLLWSFGAVLGILALVHIFIQPISIYTYTSLFAVFIAFVAVGAARIDSNFFIKAICAGETDEKVIALTFDDGPDPENTPKILEFLKKREWLGTFFCIGNKIDGNEELVKRIDREGHLLGNHSYNHSLFFDFYFSKKVRTELQLTREKILNCIHKKVRFFRPPYGVTNPHISKAVQQEDYKVIGWNIRTMDTVQQDTDKIFQKIKRQLKPGSILLFHDTKPVALEVLKKLSPYLEKEGYRVIRLDDLIGEPAYHY